MVEASAEMSIVLIVPLIGVGRTLVMCSKFIDRLKLQLKTIKNNVGSLSPYPSLLGLPPEVAEGIFAKCSGKDLINVAQCSKQCCDNVRDLLWSELRIHWISLENTNLIQEKLKYIHLTTSLEIYQFICDDCQEKHCDITADRYKAADGFRHILNMCDPSRLRSLEFDGYLPPGLLGLASSVLTELTQLRVVEIKLPTTDEWKSICNFRKLVELRISDCNIDDSTLEGIEQLTQLRKLRVECFHVNLELLLQRTSVLHHLEELMLIEHGCEEEDEAAPQNAPVLINTMMDSQPLPTLSSLKELNLSLEKLLDRHFVGVSKRLPCLTKIHLENCTNLSESILIHIVKLHFLKEVQIIGTKVTDEGIRTLSLSTTLAILIIDTCEGD